MSTLLAFRHLLKNTVRSNVSSPRIWCGPYKTPLRTELKIQNMTTTTQVVLSKTDEKKNDSLTDSQDEWRTIYRLPFIRMASAFNRVKIPYGVANVFIIPIVYALDMSGQVPGEVAGLIAAVGITSWLTLAICSLGSTNLIGIMYVNDTNDRIKLAYVDFWGKRHDIMVHLDDLMVGNENRKLLNLDFITTLKVYSNEKMTFKLLQRHGEIEDPEAFAGIFGD